MFANNFWVGFIQGEGLLEMCVFGTLGSFQKLTLKPGSRISQTATIADKGLGMLAMYENIRS